MLDKIEKTNENMTVECSGSKEKKKWSAPQFSELSAAQNTEGMGTMMHPSIENIFYTTS